MISLLKITPVALKCRTRTEDWGVPYGKKNMLDDLCSGISWNAVGSKFSVHKSTIGII